MKKTGCCLLFLMVLCTAMMVYAEEAKKTGTITGKLMIKNGGPMAKGVVYFFNDASGPPPSPDRYWRVPDEVASTDAEGNFNAQLVEGRYFLGAIKRLSGQELGPPEEGDYFLQSQKETSGVKTYAVKKGATTDVGTIAEAVPYKKTTLKTNNGITAIEGAITDTSGKPVEGALVFAFLTPAMVGKPLFVSERTGKDGKYLLRFDQGGKYYLKIRDVYGGGAPKVGEIIGGYGQEKPIPVTVNTGMIVKGIEIKGIRFLGRGPNK